MKKFAFLFVSVLIALLISEIVQGMILTYLYTANFYSTADLEIAMYVRLGITALIVTLFLWIMLKVKSVFANKFSQYIE